MGSYANQLDLLIEVREVYGKRHFFPANVAARALAAIADKKSLSPRVLRIAVNELGATYAATNVNNIRLLDEAVKG